ncbi:prolyl 3-hydroxylase sudestada1 isoform X2 [Agrilus planipennis]|uniref:uS12 prolyl 3-hydroxylase n=1 Tax=Agrilus planipennis TaxID=224129 RepID=A0A7F5RAF5_AGRPL|nr:prolyl 3-hydroxylase sudestada1 isoform X2 [Agrilus planipennis]
MGDGNSEQDNITENGKELDEKAEVNSEKQGSHCKLLAASHSEKSLNSHNQSNEEPPCKQFKSSVNINGDYTNEKFITKFKEHWNNSKPFLFNNSELIVKPFKVTILPNFIEDNFLLTKIREEFNEIEWHKRNMDLYEFLQSSDLKHLGSSKYISIFYKFLEEIAMKWISDITGLELVKVSATCSLYGDTDYLLVHDDQQEDRMVAFILYLTEPDWKESYGGNLQLLNKNEFNEPLDVVRDIFPSNNQFVFFQVTNDSYHQVSEVTSKNNCRLSINGWFHSKLPPIFQAPLYNPPTNGIFSQHFISPQEADIDLSDWISEEYLDDKTAEDIQAHIEENSEISLCSYFKQVVIQTILEELKIDGIHWTQVGPPNRFLYSKLEEKNLPHTLERLLLLFKSEQMFDLLKKYTDLDLKCLKYEMQKWTPGNYMLLSDYDWAERNELDLILYLGCTDPNSVIGGRTMYVSVEDEVQQAFITVEPQENNLNIIFRDTARFTKYFSKQSTCKCFYMLICSYSE